MKRSLSILVAEDSDAVRYSVTTALEAAGHRVDGVADGRTALDRLLAGRYDVLLTDLWMPDKDGLDLLKDVRTRLPGLRVLVMTGGGARMTIETATALAEVWGAERVFLKPFDEDALVATVEETG